MTEHQLSLAPCPQRGRFREKIDNAGDFIKRFGIPIMIGFSVVSIISASYVGVNGSHVWRQSDSYSQILGMLGQPGLGPFDNFFGQTAVFDMPIYEAIIAGIATITHGEPLVIVRIVGAVLFIVFVYSCARIANALRPGSGLVLAALLAASPLYLHYFATPLPDLLSITCSSVATILLMTSNGSPRYWQALPLLAIAAFIKSPVPFVFLAFYVTWLPMNRGSALSCRRSWLRLGGVLMVALSATVFAEIVRWWITRLPPLAGDKARWYFGVPRDRVAWQTWLTAGKYFARAFAFEWLAIVALIILAVCILFRGIAGLKLLLPLAVGFLSGWLVFPVLYFSHNYYSLPTMFMMFTAVSIAVCESAGKVRQTGEWPTAVAVVLVLAVSIMIIYGHRLSSNNVTSEGDAMRYVLRDVDHFVYVSDELIDPTPVPGGLAAKPFTTVSPSQFTSDCANILKRAHAVVVRRQNADDSSECVTMARKSADSFILGPTYEIIVLGDRSQRG